MPSAQRGPDGTAFRVADLRFFPAADGRVVVHAPSIGVAEVFDPQTLALLQACDRFRSLDDHALVAGESGPAGWTRRELARLARAGFLTARSDLVGGPEPAPDPPVAPIRSVCVPTRDRTDALSRAVTSYLDNARDNGHDVEVVVADDAPDPAGRQRTVAELATLSTELGFRIRYAGRDEKTAYLHRLAAAGDVPIEVLRFAIFGGGGDGLTTVGGNRNALLLATVGDPILMVDDDTECVPGRPPVAPDGFLVSDGNPLSVWFHPDREAAFGGAGPPTGADLIGEHSRYLGRGCRAVLAAAEHGPGPLDLDRADPALLARLAGGSGRVRMTAAGTAGDSSWDSPLFHFFQDDETRRRLVASETAYQAARRSRDVVQAAPVATLTGTIDPGLAMCLGLDNTELLPPFPPTGRGEEVTLAAVSSRCFPEAYGVHLPLTVRHDPRGVRQFSGAGLFAVRLGSWLPMCVGRFDPGFTEPGAARLRLLGNHLTDLGRAGADVLGGFVRHTALASMAAVIGRLEEQLAATDGQPEYWAGDVRRMIRRIRRDAIRPVPELCEEVGGVDGLSKLLIRYGEVLTWWPQIVATARRLRDDGDQLAVPVAAVVAGAAGRAQEGLRR